MPLDPEVKITEGTKVWHPETSNIYGCQIGRNCNIGSHVVIQPDVVIGDNCKIQSFCFIPTGVTIEDGVFVGPGVIFTNDRYPKAENPDWQLIPTLVKKGASIGAASRILCGIEIGEDAMIGMGSVVVKNVLPNETVAGNPAKILNKK